MGAPGGRALPGKTWSETLPARTAARRRSHLGTSNIRDLNATILHQLGLDHNRFTYPYRGLDQKLTGVEPAKVMGKILIRVDHQV